MASLLLADSFHVGLTDADPTVVGLPLHMERFRRGVDELVADGTSMTYEGATGFEEWLTQAFEQIDAYTRLQGASFPRLECVGNTSRAACRVLLRPAPTLTSSLSLTTKPLSPLTQAHLKGPHIAEYADLMRSVGGEVLFTASHPERTIVEGTTTSLLWWEKDTLVRVPQWCDAFRVRSVTEHLVSEIARAEGSETVRLARTHEELQRHEVWAVNALHGIRTVSHIDGVPLPEPDRARLTRFTGRLTSFASPLLPQQ